MRGLAAFADHPGRKGAIGLRSRLDHALQRHLHRCQTRRVGRDARASSPEVFEALARGIVDAGADVYLTGEASEQNFHLANETGVAFIAAGHHATERYGVQALGQAIAQTFGIQVEFLDLDNPI